MALDASAPGARDVSTLATARAARVAVTALQDALDDVDLARPGPAGDAALVTWLDGLESADELLAGLVPDPRRRYAHPEDPAFGLDTAQRLLDARAGTSPTLPHSSRPPSSARPTPPTWPSPVTGWPPGFRQSSASASCCRCA